MKKILFIFILILVSKQYLFSQIIDPKVEVIYIYNFWKNIDWKNDTHNNFTIGVYGSSKVLDELKIFATSRKKLGNKEIVIKYFANLNDIEYSQILVISREKSNEIKQIVDKHSQNTLIITESQGLVTKGSCISFIVQLNKLQFEINQKQILNNNLNVSNSLLQLAKNVIK